MGDHVPVTVEVGRLDAHDFPVGELRGEGLRLGPRESVPFCLAERGASPWSLPSSHGWPMTLPVGPLSVLRRRTHQSCEVRRFRLGCDAIAPDGPVGIARLIQRLVRALTGRDDRGGHIEAGQATALAVA